MAIDELETRIEDMKSTTEEFQAVNEELQSANEELAREWRPADHSAQAQRLRHHTAEKRARRRSDAAP